MSGTIAGLKMPRRKKTEENPAPVTDNGQGAQDSGEQNGSGTTRPSRIKAAKPTDISGESLDSEAGAWAPDIDFPVVGIGASAGGLGAFKRLIAHLPENTGMAFVLIQHLDPKHSSMLVPLLGASTALAVTEARDNQRVEPNHIYVIPPNCSLAIHHGALQLLDRIMERGKHLPVDYFFRALSEDRGSKAIGVVLSGTASDGTLGLKSIKSSNGITFAQDEASAEYFGMPGSAIAADCVDYVLPPKEIARELARIARHPFVLHDHPGELEPTPNVGDHLAKIFMLLRSRKGNDFTYYKQSTIMRRIRRRMMVHKLERIRDYVRYLQATPGEVDLLFQDLLINVTGFFRDPNSFDALRERVFPKILAALREDQPLRIWVPGCSTGDEAYSLAMALIEHLGDRNAHPQVQIFATDIDEKAINIARSGIYSERIAEEVGQARLQRFFVKVAAGYQISKVIRDMCVFAVQNVTKDPPFSRLDLVCCRNLLIYLGTVLQKRIIQVFHYALLPSGFLMLGTSESIGSNAELFSLVDKKNKIYAKKSITSRLNYDFNARTFQQIEHDQALAAPVVNIPPHDLQREADSIILAEYGPAAVIVNADMEILHFRGETGPYLNPAPGLASLNLLKMARQELAVELRAAAHNAAKEDREVIKAAVRYRRNGSEDTINIRVRPMHGPVTAERNLLVLFEKTPQPETGPVGPADRPGETPAAEDERIAPLERELASTREYMQSVIEEQEGTNEELKSANEEIQSTNEELATVNEELETRNNDLAIANNDLTNLLSNVSLPILMLGHDMKVRQFTPQAEKLLNLIGSDLGRPIGNIKANIDIPDLETTVLQVVDRMMPKELEVQDHLGHWYSVRIRPYKTLDNRIDGVVITFIDIDQLKDVEQLNAMLAQERRLATVVRDSNDAVAVHDFHGRITAWNPAAERIYGYSEAEALSMNARDILPPEKHSEYEGMMTALRAGNSVSAFETQRLRHNGQVFTVWLSATSLINEQGRPYAVATTERDLSPVKGRSSRRDG